MTNFMLPATALGYFNYDEMRESLPYEPFFLNSLATKDEVTLLELLKNFTKLELDVNQDTLEPSCICGGTRSILMLNTQCPLCKTRVQIIDNGTIQLKLWCRRPEGVSKFLNVAFLTQLRRRFAKRGFDIIWWLIDSKYKMPPNKEPKYIGRIYALPNFQRSYNWFIENLDLILETLFSIKELSPIKKGDDTSRAITLLDLYVKNKHLLLSDTIPLIPNKMSVVEATSVGKFLQHPTINAMLAAVKLVSVARTNKYKAIELQNKVARGLLAISDFGYGYTDVNLGRHDGDLRKLLYGFRSPFTSRYTIVLNNDIHTRDTLVIPWEAGLIVYYLQIANKLLRRGYTPNAIKKLVYGSVNVFNPLLASILTEILAEANDPHTTDPSLRGLAMLFVRYPTQGSKSMQLYTDVRIDFNPNTKVIKIPGTSCPAFNADFDGDQMATLSLLDRYMQKLLANLGVHKTTYVPVEPYAVAGTVGLPDPDKLTITSFGSYKDAVQETPERMDLFSELLE